MTCALREASRAAGALASRECEIAEIMKLVIDIIGREINVICGSRVFLRP